MVVIAGISTPDGCIHVDYLIALVDRSPINTQYTVFAEFRAALAITMEGG